MNAIETLEIRQTIEDHEGQLPEEKCWDGFHLFHSRGLHHLGSFQDQKALVRILADVLGLRDFTSHGSQVAAQGAAEELEQHLEADAG